ncbi:MAG: MATE family efflux transporter [Verrucomicrobiaceae bacterium]|nr:MAG: MATE family efflux transporter [Verrucomicrobiaceae bacterium]
MSKPGASVEASQRAAEVRLGGRMAGLSLPRQVLALALWPLLEQVLAFFVGLTDLLISGRMAEGAERVAILDAMGLGGYVGWFFNILQGAVATGVMALVSRAVGGRDTALANRGLGQGLWLGAAAGLGSLVLLQSGISLLIGWIGLSPAAAVQADAYLRTLAIAGPFSGAMFAVTAALRGSGDTRTPFLAMIVVNVVNMALSWMLVFAPAPLGGHGVTGIAAGTVGGWIAGLLTVVLLLGHGKKDRLHWSRASLRPHGDTLRRIVRVGAPQSLEIACMWLIHAYGIRVIAGLKDEGALGAHILAIRVESMSFLPGFAIATAAAALAGQYLGAGSREMAVKAVRLCWKTAVLLMTTMGVFFVLGRDWLIGWMAPGSELHATLAAPLLVVCALTQPFFATCITLKTSMRGAGATHIVMRWSFGSMLFYRVFVLWMMPHFMEVTLTAVWIVLGLDLFTQALIFARLHFRGKWLDARV